MKHADQQQFLMNKLDEFIKVSLQEIDHDKFKTILDNFVNKGEYLVGLNGSTIRALNNIKILISSGPVTVIFLTKNFELELEPFEAFQAQAKLKLFSDSELKRTLIHK